MLDRSIFPTFTHNCFSMTAFQIIFISNTDSQYHLRMLVHVSLRFLRFKIKMFPLRACRFGLVRSRQPFRGDESFPRNPPWLARGLRDVRGHLRFLRPSSRLIPGKIEFSLLRDRDRSQLEIHQPGKLNLRLSPRRRLPFEKCKINKNKNHTLKRHLPVPDLRRSRIPVGFVD